MLHGSAIVHSFFAYLFHFSLSIIKCAIFNLLGMLITFISKIVCYLCWKISANCLKSFLNIYPMIWIFSIYFLQYSIDFLFRLGLGQPLLTSLLRVFYSFLLYLFRLLHSHLFENPFVVMKWKAKAISTYWLLTSNPPIFFHH